MNADQLSLGDGAIGDTASWFLGSLGTPIDSTQVDGDDDGRVFMVLRYRTDGLEVDVDSRTNRIVRMATTDSALRSGNGLLVGMSVGEVAIRTGADSSTIRSALVLEVCNEIGIPIGPAAMKLVFDPASGPFGGPGASRTTRRLRSIELTSYGP